MTPDNRRFCIYEEEQMGHEYKSFPALVTGTDEEQGIVETVFAVFGNVDGGADVAHPGSFAKTFAERGLKVKVLDHHNARSIMSVIGRPLELRELRRDELPPELLQQYPDANGGAYAKVQLLMDTPEGKGAFIRLRDKAVDEWSFGYDALDVDYSKTMHDGEQITVRNLRTVKLYEISPVIWGMNSATTTLGAKEDIPPEAPAPPTDAERKASAAELLRQAIALLEGIEETSAPADDAGRDDAAPEPEAGPDAEPPTSPELERERLELLSQIESQMEG